MRNSFVLLVWITVATLTLGASALCAAADFRNSGGYFPSMSPCAPKQDVQRVVRTVRVNVPVPRQPPCYVPPACVPPHMSRLPAMAAPPAPRPVPVSVDIAVRPESCVQRRAVPVVYRDPGFLGPIVRHSIGLVGATIAAPFRVAEMLCPVTAPVCPPRRPCGPPLCSVNQCYPQPVPCRLVPPCPAPMRRPMPCRPVLKCAPPGPSVGPLPHCSAVSSCGPNLSPALMEDYRFPQCEPQNLLSGIWNLPGQLVRTCRLIGDFDRRPPCAPPMGW